MAFNIQNLEDLRKAIKRSLSNSNFPKESVQNSVSGFLEQTGLIDESLNVLEDELKCPICFGIPLEACLTKCHHVFCTFCLSMALIMDKWQCPICRTPLPYSLKRLIETDMIIQAVMLKCNPQYNSWAKQKNLERLCEYNAKDLQNLHEVTAQCLKDLKSYYINDKIIMEVGYLSQRFLSLKKELPSCQAEVERFIEKKEELTLLAYRTLQPLKSLGYSLNLTSL